MSTETILKFVLSAATLLQRGPKTLDDWGLIEYDLETAKSLVTKEIEIRLIKEEEENERENH